MAETKLDEKKSISYDEKADVLYITLEEGEGVAEHLSSNVMVRKSDKDGHILGITIEDFTKSVAEA